MLTVRIGILLTLICVGALNGEYPSSTKPCNVGDITENDCNKCICSSHHIFECNPKPCKDNRIPKTKKKPTCHPNKVYVRNSTVCLCKETGSWPHPNCETIFRSFPKNTKQGCKPNSYVIDDCNVCRCGPGGKVDRNHCTKHECEKKDKAEPRRFIHHNQVYGSCEAKNWYSLAPCQFCYCISENKLVCNAGNNYSKTLQLGSYNLSICGKDLVKDAVSLVPNGKKALTRIGNKVESLAELLESVVDQPIEEENRVSTEFNREFNEKTAEKLIDKKVNDSEEYYSDSEEVRPLMPLGRKGSSAQLPKDVEGNDVSESVKEPSGESDSDVMMSVPINAAQLPPPENRPQVPPRDSAAEPLAPNLIQTEQIKKPVYFHWSNAGNSYSTSGVEKQVKEVLKLGNVLKPYLPVVFDKVFDMAFRKSMLSLDANSNCTPGSTTMLKCKSCFCMKNNKLLCTKQKCNKTNST